MGWPRWASKAARPQVSEIPRSIQLIQPDYSGTQGTPTSRTRSVPAARTVSRQQPRAHRARETRTADQDDRAREVARLDRVGEEDVERRRAERNFRANQIVVWS